MGRIAVKFFSIVVFFKNFFFYCFLFNGSRSSHQSHSMFWGGVWVWVWRRSIPPSRVSFLKFWPVTLLPLPSEDAIASRYWTKLFLPGEFFLRLNLIWSICLPLDVSMPNLIPTGPFVTFSRHCSKVGVQVSSWIHLFFPHYASFVCPSHNLNKIGNLIFCTLIGFRLPTFLRPQLSRRIIPSLSSRDVHTFSSKISLCRAPTPSVPVDWFLFSPIAVDL